MAKKEQRERIWNKYGKHCAYCGKEITYKQMQIDHIEPVFRGFSDDDAKRCKIAKGSEDESNLNPSCARCNRWKSTHSLEQFRIEVSKQTERLFRDSAAYRMALDYGLIKESLNPIVFYFEKPFSGFEPASQEFSDRIKRNIDKMASKKDFPHMKLKQYYPVSESLGEVRSTYSYTGQNDELRRI